MVVWAVVLKCSRYRGGRGESGLSRHNCGEKKKGGLDEKIEQQQTKERIRATERSLSNSSQYVHQTGRESETLLLDVCALSLVAKPEDESP